MHAELQTFARGFKPDVLGRALARSRRSGASIVTDLNLIASHADAEAVLEEATLAYGGSTEGYGLAATTSTCARLLTCDEPVAAPLYASDRIANGGKMQVTPSLVGVGVDLHFRFGRPFPSVDDDPACLDSIRDAIVACHVGLQIVGRRSGHGTPLNTWTALADFGLAAYHVRGEAILDWQKIDLRAVPAVLKMDGHEIGWGHGGDALGDPLAALRWLAQRLQFSGSYIEASSFVAIGSCTGLSQLIAGHTYSGKVGSGYEVSLQAE